MKTRKMWLGAWMLVIVLFPQLLRAQNVRININAGQLSILNGKQGILDVQICNDDPSLVSTPPNSVAVLISFETNLTILGITKLDGTPLTDFDMLFLSNDDGPGSHDVKVRYKNPLVAFGDCGEFRVTVQGNAVGSGAVAGNLQFEQLLQSNNAIDDNSESSIPVLINFPVTLRDFNADKVERSTVLKWTTTEETNSDRFEVQRSIKGKEWTTIESVQSAGESTATRSYEAVDRNPLSGENLYRLKMIDKDSSYAFSSVKSVKFDGALASVYPNPVVDYLHLNDENWSKVVQVTILDKTGRQVYVSGKKPESKIDVRSLASGIYNVRVKNADGLESSYRIAVGK